MPSKHQADLLAAPAFDASFDQLWDLREVTEISVTPDTVRQLASARSFKPGARRAVVAPNDLAFGLARMFQLLHDEAPEEFRVFRSVKGARSWLGLA